MGVRVITGEDVSVVRECCDPCVDCKTKPVIDAEFGRMVLRCGMCGLMAFGNDVYNAILDWNIKQRCRR